MWVLIDNYDSFSYLLYDHLLRLHEDIHIVQAGDISLEELIILQPKRLIISPGPKTPQDALDSSIFVDYFLGKIPILGVCLGHQLLGLKLGAMVSKAPLPMHGKLSAVKHISNHDLLVGIKKNSKVMRYHSLIVSDWEYNRDILPLLCTAEDGLLLMFVNERYNIVGYQFHPESVGTEQGMLFLSNWDTWLTSKCL